MLKDDSKNLRIHPGEQSQNAQNKKIFLCFM